MNHRKGYPSAEEAMRSKAFLTVPGAFLDLSCPCGEIHVTVPKDAPVPLPRSPRERKAPRDTGFSRSVKLAVRARAGDGVAEVAGCESCGTWLGRYGGEIQHRAARGAGGCRDEVINSTANGALLCRPCHRICEDRDEHMGMDAAGFWIKHGTTPEFDPRNVRIMWHVRPRLPGSPYGSTRTASTSTRPRKRGPHDVPCSG